MLVLGLEEEGLLRAEDYAVPGAVGRLLMPVVMGDCWLCATEAWAPTGKAGALPSRRR